MRIRESWTIAELAQVLHVTTPGLRSELDALVAEGVLFSRDGTNAIEYGLGGPAVPEPDGTIARLASRVDRLTQMVKNLQADAGDAQAYANGLATRLAALEATIREMHDSWSPSARRDTLIQIPLPSPAGRAATLTIDGAVGTAELERLIRAIRGDVPAPDHG